MGSPLALTALRARVAGPWRAELQGAGPQGGGLLAPVGARGFQAPSAPALTSQSKSLESLGLCLSHTRKLRFPDCPARPEALNTKLSST